MRLQQSIAGQLKKRKELLYNLGAISSYASMLTFFWHGVSMLVAKEHPKHTLVVYAALTFFTIVVNPINPSICRPQADRRVAIRPKPLQSMQSKSIRKPAEQIDQQ